MEWHLRNINNFENWFESEIVLWGSCALKYQYNTKTGHSDIRKFSGMLKEISV